MLETLLTADRALGIWLASLVESRWVDQLMIGASLIGTGGSIWIATAFIIWLVKPAKGMAVWRLMLSILLAGVVVDHVMKPLINRQRPWVDHPEYRDLGWRPDTRSFPSGHAATAAAGALALARIVPAAALPAWGLALLIAFSRIALGLHFPLDVVAGFLVGTAAALFACARPPDPAAVS